MTIEDKEKLRLLKEWQHRLRLDDWDISLMYDCSPNDMVLKDVAGESEYVESDKIAVIRIITKKDYGKRVVDFDFERILVHELLHCKFSLVYESENAIQSRLVHQYIDDMAKALVDAKRSGNGK